MADLPSVVAESLRLPNFDLAHSYPPTIQPVGYVSDTYSPLPPGCWTLDFHGNCPRCYHRHSAVQVQVKVTQDPGQVSYVHCERCKERWAAFGGRNTTRISLLSNATTEPDSIDRGVRYHLIDIVKLATTAASLGTLPESTSSHVPSRQPSMDSSTNDELRASSPSPKPSDPARYAESMSLSEAVQHHQRLQATTPPSAEHPITLKSHSRPRRLLSRFKNKMAARFPIFHRHNVKINPLKEPKMSARQFEKSPIRTPPVANQRNISAEQSPTTLTVHNDSAHTNAARPEVLEVDVAAPSERLAEVVTFIASLDKSVLESMNDQERVEWMRKTYSEFKARRKRSQAPLAISTIVHTSIPWEPLRSVPRSLDQRSADVLHAGAHIEGLDLIRAAWRSGSITSSDLNTETQSASDDSTVTSYPQPARQEFLERVRRGLRSQRPLSLDSAPRSAPHLRSRLRHSFDALIFNGTESTSTLRGPASSRWSVSTLRDRATQTTYEMVPQQTEYHDGSHEGHDADSPDPPSPSLSAPRHNPDQST